MNMRLSDLTGKTIDVIGWISCNTGNINKPNYKRMVIVFTDGTKLEISTPDEVCGLNYDISIATSVREWHGIMPNTILPV